MKRHGSGIVGLVLFLSFLIWTTGNAQLVVSSISDISRNPHRYDGKVVSLDGKVHSLKVKVTKKGNPYSTFQLRDASGRSMTVFSFGVLEVKEGDPVRVRGKYIRSKQFSSKFKISNTSDASHGGVQRKDP